MITTLCTNCGREGKSRPKKDGSAKIPVRWKLIGGELTCKTCAESAYYTRAIRVEIRGLIESDDRTSQEFRAALSAASKASARFGNWYVQRLYAVDLAAGPRLERTADGKEKLPACPQLDIYRDAVRMFPELSGGCISGLSQIVRRWYSDRRFDVFVRLARSVENYRFGYLPVEVRKQDWSIREDAEGKLFIRTSVCPGRSWNVSIHADGRNMAKLKQMSDGSAIPLALKIIRATKQPIAGSNAPPRKAWFFRISAMFPRGSRSGVRREKRATLTRSADSLLVADAGDPEDLFVFPGATIRKLIIGGDAADRRWQQEQSLQRGIWSTRKRRRWGKDRTRMAESRRRKVDDQVKLCAASLARWARSNAVTVLDYDARDRGFVPHFPWRKLLDATRNACEAVGCDVNVLHESSDEGDDQ